MTTKKCSEKSEFKTLSEEMNKISKRLGVDVTNDAKPEPVRETQLQSKPANDELFEFVVECAMKVKNLFGIPTMPETIKAIAEELPRLNPHILLNKDVILRCIGFIDMQYRNPKQLLLEDFTFSPEKIKMLKEKRVILYTQEKLDEIMESYNQYRHDALKGKIEFLENELEIEKFKNKYIPEIQGIKALSHYKDTIQTLLIQNEDLIEKLNLKDRIIVRLERVLNRHNLLKNETENLESEIAMETKETVGA